MAAWFILSCIAGYYLSRTKNERIALGVKSNAAILHGIEQVVTPPHEIT